MATYIELPIPDTPSEEHENSEEYDKFAKIYDAFRVLRDTLGDYFLALDDLPAGNGILVKKADGTYEVRTLTGTANEITVTNGDGDSGAPTISLPAALTFTGKTVTGGTFVGAAIDDATKLDFGSVIKATTNDLSSHIALWSTVYGFNITSGFLNTTVGAGGGMGWNRAGTQLMTLNASNQLLVTAGTAALPVLSFILDPNTGFTNYAADSIGISLGGTQKWFIAANNAIIGDNAATSQTLTINGAVATSRAITWTTAASKRWEMLASNEAESGSNAGSNFGINAYSDTGVLIGTVLYLVRAAGGAFTILRPVDMSASRISNIANGAANSPGLAFASTRGFYDNGTDSIWLSDGTRGRVQFALQGSGNTGLEIGRVDGVASQVFIDFHAGATAVDYDARLLCTNGTGAIGGGDLQVVAASLISSRFTQTSANDENPTISQFMVTNGSDNALRKASKSHAMQQSRAGHIIAEGSLNTAGDTTFNVPSGTWRRWELEIVSLPQPSADYVMWLRFNNDSGNNYSYAQSVHTAGSGVANTTAASVAGIALTKRDALTDNFNYCTSNVIIPEPSAAPTGRMGHMHTADANATPALRSLDGTWFWGNGAITSIQILLRGTVGTAPTGSTINAASGSTYKLIGYM